MYVFLVMGFVLLNALVVPPIHLPGCSTSIGFRTEINRFYLLSILPPLRLVSARMEWYKVKPQAVSLINFNPPWTLYCCLVLEENRRHYHKNRSFCCFPTPTFFSIRFIFSKAQRRQKGYNVKPKNGIPTLFTVRL